LEISGDVLSTADMVVQRRDGPRRLREIDDDDNPPLSFLQAGCPSCRPTNSVKALKAGHSHRSFEANSRLVQCSVAELHASTANSNSDNDNQIVWLHCSIS